MNDRLCIGDELSETLVGIDQLGQAAEPGGVARSESTLTCGSTRQPD